MSTTSHTYTVGRSEGVLYPPSVGPAPTAIQLAALYDQQAQRIAQLHAATPPTDLIAFLRDYNRWRQGADLAQPDPAAITAALEAALTALETYDRLKNATSDPCLLTPDS